MKHRIVSFFNINTQFDNVGDALINRELVKLASNHGPVVVNLSNCPPRFRETLRLEGLPNVTLVDGSFALFSKLFKHRMGGGIPIFLLKPGGYFGGLGSSFLFKAIAVLLFQSLLALFGTKICQIGISYERLSRFHSLFLRIRRPLLHALYVRDEKSFNYAKRLGLKPDGIKPDLAFNIYEQAVESSSSVKNIALSFRTDQYPQQIDQIAILVKWLVNSLNKYGLEQIVFVAQVKRDQQPADQLSGMIEKEFGVKAPVVVCFDSIGDCEQAYATCDLIISNRLHSLLIGGSRCSKLLGCVSENANEKIMGLFDTLNLTDHLVDIGNFDEALADKALQTALKNDFDGRPIALSLKQSVERLFSDIGE